MKIIKNGNYERIKIFIIIVNVLVVLSCFMICSFDECCGFELVSGLLFCFFIVIFLLLDVGELVILLVFLLVFCLVKKFMVIVFLFFCICFVC